MRTPAGKECPHYYADYFRGKNTQECRLIGRNPAQGNWAPDLCKNCPVPGITQANACPNMIISASIESAWLGLKRKVQVKAYCTRTNRNVAEPHVGCGECHPLPPEFKDI